MRFRSSALGLATVVVVSLAEAGHASAALPVPILPAPGAVCADVTLDPAPENLDRVREAIRCLVNHERSERGLGALTVNATLLRAGEWRARDMISRGWFGHVSPGGENTPAYLRRLGYVRRNRSFLVGENLAWGEQRFASPLATVRGWMLSRSHRANVLKPGYREIGVGLVRGVSRAATGGRPASDGWSYVTELGARG